MAISHPPNPSTPLSPTQFPLSLHLFLFCSPSAHHSTQQINCREKLRLAKQGGGSRASGIKKKKRWRETADESFVIVWMELLLQVLIWVAGLWVAPFQTAQLGLKIGVRFQPESLKFSLDLNKACGVTKTPLNSVIISRLVFDHAQGQSSHSLTQTLCV